MLFALFFFLLSFLFLFFIHSFCIYLRTFQFLLFCESCLLCCLSFELSLGSFPVCLCFKLGFCSFPVSLSFYFEFCSPFIRFSFRLGFCYFLVLFSLCFDFCSFSVCLCLELGLCCFIISFSFFLCFFLKNRSWHLFRNSFLLGLNWLLLFLLTKLPHHFHFFLIHETFAHECIQSLYFKISFRTTIKHVRLYLFL